MKVVEVEKSWGSSGKQPPERIYAKVVEWIFKSHVAELFRLVIAEKSYNQSFLLETCYNHSRRDER